MVGGSNAFASIGMEDILVIVPGIFVDFYMESFSFY